MASNVTSNPSSAKSPSPAPAPGVLPVQSIPAGTDVRTIESITQALEVTSDFVGHIQSSGRFDVPVLNSGSTGFTAPTLVAFGGTVTPSGSAHIADGTRFMIQIQTGGAVGTATFKTSTDGGNTFGALQTTAASMTDATSGITLAFSGTFTSAGTATFRAAFTPLVSWNDSAGNRRSIVDHVGYRRGRINEYYEDWLCVGSGTVTGANSNTSGRLSWSVPAGATLSLAAPNNTHPMVLLSHASVANATTSRLYSSGGVMSCGNFTEAVMEFEVTMTATATDVQIGMVGVNIANTVTGTPSTGIDDLALCAQATDTNWQLLTNSAGSGAVTKVDTGVPKTTALTRVTLWLFGTASPYGGAAVMFLNEGAPIVATSNLPFGFGALGSFIVAATTTNSTNSLSLRISPARILSPRYASIPAL